MTSTTATRPASTAMYQVLGAISYGEHKAWEGAKQAAQESDDSETTAEWRKIAADELRHYKGFTRRLSDLGGDPERAMAPFIASLDTYHSSKHADPLTEAVWGYVGEGVADDLLTWFRKVADPETAKFVDSVIADEVEHEARAARELESLMGHSLSKKLSAGRAARSQIVHMISSGGDSGLAKFLAFVRVGKPHELVAAVVGGYTRRMHAVGLTATGIPFR